MQNLGSLACSVWAVGGGGSKMLLHILYSEETCKYTKGGSRRLEKSHKVWMMMMIAASLMWAGAAEREREQEREQERERERKREHQREQPKLVLKS